LALFVIFIYFSVVSGFFGVAVTKKNALFAKFICGIAKILCIIPIRIWGVAKR
jgi:hypothetical protein